MCQDRDIASTLDARGHRCPLPVLLARKALAGLAPGAVLEVLADDPAADDDLSALCRTTGHRLIHSHASGGVHRFLIEVS
jgi:tRNA 2-thiouridine synthesizing protein A